MVERGRAPEERALGAPLGVVAFNDLLTGDPDALAAHAERLEVLLEHTSDIITVLEADGTIRYSNPAAGVLSGHDADVNGSSAFALVHPDDAAYVADRFLHVLQSEGTVGPVEFRLRYADGSWHAVEAFASNLLDHPSVRGVVVTIRDITDRKVAEARLAHQVGHDTLTGLPNRVLLLDRLGQALARAYRDGRNVALMLYDLDHFKKVNESLGHDAGDQLLVEVAARMLDLLGPADTVARLGGDEFVVVCEGVASDDDALALAERINDVLTTPYQLAHGELFVTLSMGVVVDGGRATPEHVLRDADTAMSRAKERGRARRELFREALHLEAVERLDTETALRHAIARGELRLHYQPTISLRTGRADGMEALARWDHPERGLLGAGAFIPLAEETGLILPIGSKIVLEACLQVAALRQVSPELVVSVNLSARQLAQHDLVGMLDWAIGESGCEPQALCLEITESALMDDAEMALRTLTQLKTLGLRLAIDDFGTGYSSLAYLKRLPVDVIKIDRSFVVNLVDDPADRAIVGAVIRLAHTLGLSVTGEGVETVEQRDCLTELGCDRGQGFLWTRARPMDELQGWLAGVTPPP